MREQCDHCGRFMAHRWYLSTDEPDSWQDYWTCSRCDGRTSALEAFADRHNAANAESETANG